MKIRPELANHPLNIAAREADDASEKMHLPEWTRTVGLEADDLMYVAQQRALRCVLLLVRKMTPEQVKNFKREQMFHLSSYELHLYHMFSACEMDGIAIGWTAKQQENKTCKEK